MEFILLFFSCFVNGSMKCARSWNDVSKMEAWPMYRCKMSKSAHDYRKDARKNSMLLGNQSKYSLNLDQFSSYCSDGFLFIILLIFYLFSHRVAANRIVCSSTQNVKISITMMRMRMKMKMWRRPMDQMLFQTTLNQQLLPLQVCFWLVHAICSIRLFFHVIDDRPISYNVRTIFALLFPSTV